MSRSITIVNSLSPGDSLSWANTKPRQAFTTGLELSPENPQAYCNLGLALRDQVKFAEAVESLQRSHNLGTWQNAWTYPSKRCLKDCEAMRDLDKKLPHASTASAPEQFVMTRFTARYHQKYSKATRLASEYFAMMHNLAKSRGIESTNWAIRAAVYSKSELERLSFSRQSREWLQEGIDGATCTEEALAVWKELLRAPEFLAFRDDALLYKLTEPERNAWSKLWDKVPRMIEWAFTAHLPVPFEEERNSFRNSRVFLNSCLFSRMNREPFLTHPRST